MKHWRRPWSRAARLAAVLCLSAGPALAQGIVETRHRVRVAGRLLEYTAHAGLLPIRHNETGELRGEMFFVAYRLARPTGARARPLTFLWNGGPGSNSALVHLSGFGPRRIDGGKLTDNQETWLTTTDLVFVDPVGTGYARPARREYAAEFFNTLGDIAATAEFVRVYRTQFDAWDAPLFIGGESYGVWRAAGVAEWLERVGVPVAGTILISGGIPSGPMLSDDLKAAMFLPTRAAAALHHRKLSPDLSRDREATLREVAEWARTDYGPALAMGDSLPASRRRAIVAQLARYTGLPVAAIDTTKIFVTRTQFAEQLLRAEGRVLARFDTRRTQPIPPAPAVPVGGAPRDSGELVVAYLRNELRYRSELAYQGIESGFTNSVTGRAGGGSVGARWQYNQNLPQRGGAGRGGAAPPSTPVPPSRTAEDGPPNGAEPWLRRTIDLNPRHAVFVATGLFDSLNSCAWHDHLAQYAARTFGWRITARCYEGGHMMYDDTDARVRLRDDVARFFTEATRAGSR